MVMYDLFNKGHVLIKTHCLVDSHTLHGKLAINLDGYIWAVSSLATEHIQICCLKESHIELLYLP